MASTIRQLISQLTRRVPAAGFEQALFQRIQRELRARARARVIGFGIGTVAGVGLLTDLVVRLAHAFAQSGFSSYLALVFSGDGAVLKLWKELGMSLLESLPLLTVIGMLAAMTLAIWAGANAITNARKAGSFAAA